MRRKLAVGLGLACLGLILSLAAGVFVASRHAPGAFAPLVAAASVAGSGGFLVLALAWHWLDSRIGAGLDRLAGDLRAIGHARVDRPLDPRPVRGLGDLGPAAHAVCEMLREERDRGDLRIAQATRTIEQERRRLVEILSEIPVAILVVDAGHRIVLYDRQSVHALAGVAALAIGRSIFDYLAEAPLRQALAGLGGATDRHFIDAELTTADDRAQLRTRLRRMGEGRGYALAIEVEDTIVAERPLVFDFSGILSAKGDISDRPLADLTYVVFDTETTGLDPARDALVQIGAVRGRNGRRIAGEVFETLVDPGRPIPPAASRIHGITDDQVQEAPSPLTALAAFHHFARDAVLVAHNAPFDLAFLRRQSAGIRLDHPVLDTVLLSAAVFGQDATHTLDAIAARLGVSLSAADRHTALGDAVATADVFFRLIKALEGRGVVTFGEAVAEMRRHGRLLRDPNGDRFAPAG